ncbi:MAG: hypothetical protein IH865_03790 [Chloroflexi bacterium]|nr:hypothetical protein [Chloroflexota bacterium]
MIELANASGRPIVSLDVPSGVDAGSGRVYEPSIKAAATLTLALPKTGLGASDVRERLGDLYLGDLSVPPAAGWGSTWSWCSPRTPWFSSSGRTAVG